MIQIKNIIFDLGAVVLNIDYEGPARVLREMGIADFEKYYSKAAQKDLFTDFEKGLITPVQFRKSFGRLTGLTLNNEEIDKVWNAIILDFPKERLELIISLRKNYNTYLLSNTNKIHYDFYTPALRSMVGPDGWDVLFDNTFFSYKMSLRKPDKEIYEAALKSASLHPNETLFIDDLFDNALAAKQAGMYALWLKEGDDISNIFVKNSKETSLIPKIELFL